MKKVRHNRPSDKSMEAGPRGKRRNTDATARARRRLDELIGPGTLSFLQDLEAMKSEVEALQFRVATMTVPSVLDDYDRKRLDDLFECLELGSNFDDVIDNARASAFNVAIKQAKGESA